jgi:hypothetical protein
MERKIPATIIMTRIICFLLLVSAITACASSRQARAKNIKEEIPDIAGTWYQDGDSNVACYIVQNKESLVFLSGKQTSDGHFKSSYEVFAKDWNSNAILSSDQQTLKWKDRTWVKATFLYPDISGTWYENGEAAKQITIVQNGTKLVMDNGSQKLNGYFYTTNGLYVMENNNYATYSPKNNTLSWGSKLWLRSPKK